MSNKISGMKYRTRLLISFLMSVIIIAVAGIYTNLSSRILMQDTSEMFSKNVDLTSAYNKLDDIQGDIEEYLSTNSSESLLSFYDNTNQLTEYVNNIEKNITYTPSGIKIKNVAGMINHYLKQADDTINAKRGRNINAYTNGYESTVKESTIITNYIKEMMSGDIIDSAEKYVAIDSRSQKVSMFNNIFICITVFIVIIIIITFSIEITKPITKLATYAEEISNGNFEIQIPHIKASGEISILYNAFNIMVLNIKEYFNRIVENQQLENSLNEQRVNNLKMKNALRESELLALQSQVNPHFIFNTINIGAKIAMLQGDKVTCTYLENAADIFRYNLKGLELNATLKDEVENVVSYMYLLNTRFGDIIKFTLEVDEDKTLQDFILPRMTLQPIIENAYIHGISQCEYGGNITLKATQDNDFVYVYVIDNGVGISQEKINEILCNVVKVKSNSKKGHTTGIGVDNVLKRLRLFFGTNDVMNIECINGETKFIFTLPKDNKGGESDVQGTDS